VPISGYTGIKIGKQEIAMTRKQSLEALLVKLKEAEATFVPHDLHIAEEWVDPIVVALERVIEEVEFNLLISRGNSGA
jgi:hypothetical protein